MLRPPRLRLRYVSDMTASIPRSRRRSRAALIAAAVAGLVHAAVSFYWGLGGTKLVETLGERIISMFTGMEWLLLFVGAAKVAGALVPLWLNERGWPRARFWRPACWLGAAGLIAWGGVNTVTANLVLSGIIVPDGGYDRPAMIGHGWLWDPLFLIWGIALAAGLWLSRGDPRE